MKESNLFTLIIPGPIVSWQRARTGRGHMYVPKKSMEWRKKIQRIAWNKLRAMGANLNETYYGNNPIRMDITCYFKPPKKFKGVIPEYCIGRMDRDNIEKGIMDSLQGIMYDNDKQVVAGYTEKRYAVSSDEFITIEMKMIGV